MCAALDDHEGSVSIGGRLNTNFRSAEEEEEAGVLVDRLDRTTTRYKMKISPDKTKVMTNNPNGFLAVACSCCPYLYFGSSIMLVTYFVNFR